MGDMEQELKLLLATSRQIVEYHTERLAWYRSQTARCEKELASALEEEASALEEEAQFLSRLEAIR